MRDINEQLSVIMHRADSIKEKESLRKYMVAQSLSLCACIALLVMTCCYLPRLTLVADTSLPVQFGSLILNTSYMSYVIVGFLAFFFAFVPFFLGQIIFGLVVNFYILHCLKAN